MSPEQAAEIASAFLKQHIESNEFFTPPEELDDDGDPTAARVMFIRAMAHESKPNAIRIFINYGRRYGKDDLEFLELRQECIVAMLRAHPELHAIELDVFSKRQT